MGHDGLFRTIFDTTMDKKIVDLGELSGDLLIFGGVYSNLQALEALVSLSRKRNIPPQNIICTGDIVGYCAQPAESLDLFRECGANAIAGNVEKQLANGAEHCGCDFSSGSRCDGFSEIWYAFAKANTPTHHLEWMAQLPDHITFSHLGRTYGVVHGSYNNTSEFIFESTPWQTKTFNHDVLECDIILAGHCGLPFKQRHWDRSWLNAGVIGMPANDGLTDTWYMVIDGETGQATHHRLKYDHHLTARLMAEKSLPEEYAKTLLTGIWDNMEILPEEEKTYFSRHHQIWSNH